MAKTIHTLRKTNIKGRPRSSGLKLFKQCDVMHTTSYHSDYPVISREVYAKSVRADPVFANNHACNQKILRIGESLFISPSSVIDNYKSQPIPIDTRLSQQRLTSTYYEDYKKVTRGTHPSPLQQSTVTSSTAHDSFRLPIIPNSLKGYTTRYDCNKNTVTKGIVPCATTPLNVSMATQYKTVYSHSNNINFKLPSLTNKVRTGRIKFKGRNIWSDSVFS